MPFMSLSSARSMCSRAMILTSKEGRLLVRLLANFQDAKVGQFVLAKLPYSVESDSAVLQHGAQDAHVQTEDNHQVGEAGPVFVSHGGDNETSADHEQQPSPDKVFVIDELIRDKGGKLIDVLLRELHHHLQADEACADSYHLFGNQLGTGCWLGPDAPLHAATRTISLSKIAEVVSKGTTKAEPFKLDVIPNSTDAPRGDLVFERIFKSTCPAHCTNGLLENPERLRAVYRTLPGTMLTLQDHKPICPICMGSRLLADQVGLIAESEEYMGIYNMELAYCRLLERLARPGYECNWEELGDLFYPGPANPAGRRRVRTVG
ncbi:uncharacterized protein LTR77_001873 [Saxophila tyrrhenica]|uniref:Uncharacterized protein n=1 Tax=Saxophila tyrrhenica TaxID=1690608 RepID=A0AAV9PLG2_9PEZI|nr:hypothetical protein LTR77_001873 [Saxophila tyrrhenica]